MNELPVEGLDEKTVIVCVSSSHRDRARVARLMNGCGTLLIFPDMEAARRVLFGEREPRADRGLPGVPGPSVVVRGALVVDLNRQRASWAGRPLPLTRIERELVAALASPPPRVWTYRELYERVWGVDYLDDASALRSTVKRVRAKLRAAGATVTVESSRGVGFYLADTEPEAETHAAPCAAAEPATDGARRPAPRRPRRPAVPENNTRAT